MGYAALSSFLSESIAKPEPIPESEKTPEYWADRLSIEWSVLGTKELEQKLLPFFIEFNRLCEFEKNNNLVQPTAVLEDTQCDHLVSEKLT